MNQDQLETRPCPARILRLCVLGGLTCCVQSGLADELTMESITVEARAESGVLPGGSRVDAAVIRMLRSATSDAASLLRDVPGLNLNATGGVSSLPSIRGLADDRLRIKVDGMDLIASCPNHMNPPLSYVDPSNVGEIKVFAGISPVSVGGDSIGGTIQLETLTPEFAAPGEKDIVRGELGAFYRGNNEAYGGNATATYASERVSIRYSGSWSQANNYSAGGNFKTSTATDRSGHELALDEVGSTAYETGNHTLGLAVKEGRHLFEADIGYQNMPEQLYPNQRMDLLDNEQVRINLGWTGEFAWAETAGRAVSRNSRSLHGLRAGQALLVRRTIASAGGQRGGGAMLAGRLHDLRCGHAHVQRK